MSEIEQAIAYLERWLPFWKERNEDSALYVELALSALREKQEREKGCEYCNGDNFRDRKNIPLLDLYNAAEVVIDSDNTLYISDIEEAISISTLQIKFCPMCGKPLKEVRKYSHE